LSGSLLEPIEEEVNKYRFESEPALLSADELQTLLPPSFDKLAGLEVGGIPLASKLKPPAIVGWLGMMLIRYLSAWWTR
jgi:hypothetical protein